MITTLIILGILISLLVIGKINLSIQFKKQVKELFSLSGNISSKKFTYDQLAGLPAPVLRYFKLVLKDGQPYISYISLKHTGQFKTGPDKKWGNIKGEQYFTTETPGYIWKGTMPFATARDMYIAGKGRLIVTLLSLINVVDVQGASFDEGEFQRWLAESVWFPTNLLPTERLQWSAIDLNTANLTFQFRELSVSYVVTFNKAGEITQMETKRFMNKEHKEIWLGKFADYREMNGMLVPTSIEATWRLGKGDFPYARFTIKQLVYNNPVKLHD
ncbi:MAG: hypothetical protein IPP72_16970 [Chitinophagaceae bacterium]|nr:hypothetical protein [Chitinophagaceae bacterium]